MTLIPKDMTSVYKTTIAKGTNAMRWQRAAYVDLLPPCNNACPAGLNIQAWLSLVQAGRYEEAWRKYMEDNPLPATHRRACYHPCETACNRQFRAFMAVEMGKRILLLLSAAISCSLAVITLATGQSPPVPPVTSEIDVTLSPSARRGFRLVRFHCARCHAIGKVGQSPLVSASAFRSLHLKYAVADLQRPLLQAEPVHPRFDLGADQVEDVMAYFKSLNGESQ